jgi:hypothetical protein
LPGIGGAAGSPIFNCAPTDPEAGTSLVTGAAVDACLSPFIDANGFKPEPEGGVKGCEIDVSVSITGVGCTSVLAGGSDVSGRRLDFPSTCAGRASETFPDGGEKVRGSDPTGGKKGEGRKPDPSGGAEMGPASPSAVSAAGKGVKGSISDPSEGRRRLNLWPRMERGAVALPFTEVGGADVVAGNGVFCDMNAVNEGIGILVLPTISFLSTPSFTCGRAEARPGTSELSS